MVAATKFQVFQTDLSNGVHNFASNTFKVMLTNTAPVVTNAVKSNITEITAGNGYTAGGMTLTLTESSASGVNTIAATNLSLAASGGSIGPFRYAVAYNSTATNGNLIQFWDAGSAITIASGSTENFNFTDTGNAFLTVS